MFCLLESLGFSNLPETAQCKIHVGYAEQLAQLDLVDLAVFVLMHIPHDSTLVIELFLHHIIFRQISGKIFSRCNAVSSMTDRLADKDAVEQWEKLVELNVPSEIIAHSKYFFDGLKNLDILLFVGFLEDSVFNGLFFGHDVLLKLNWFSKMYCFARIIRLVFRVIN